MKAGVFTDAVLSTLNLVQKSHFFLHPADWLCEEPLRLHWFPGSRLIPHIIVKADDDGK